MNEQSWKKPMEWSFVKKNEWPTVLKVTERFDSMSIEWCLLVLTVSH